MQDNLPIRADQIRLGDQFHTHDATMEISRRVGERLDEQGNTQWEIWGHPGDLLGKIDYSTEKEYRVEELEETVTDRSLVRRLRRGPQYQEGLRVGREELFDFMWSKAENWYEGESRDAIKNALLAYQRMLESR